MKLKLLSLIFITASLFAQEGGRAFSFDEMVAGVEPATDEQLDAAHEQRAHQARIASAYRKNPFAQAQAQKTEKIAQNKARRTGRKKPRRRASSPQASVIPGLDDSGERANLNFICNALRDENLVDTTEDERITRAKLLYWQATHPEDFQEVAQNIVRGKRPRQNTALIAVLKTLGEKIDDLNFDSTRVGEAANDIAKSELAEAKKARETAEQALKVQTASARFYRLSTYFGVPGSLLAGAVSTFVGVIITKSLTEQNIEEMCEQMANATTS